MECFASMLIPALFEFAQSEQPLGRMTVRIGDAATLLENLNRHAIDLAIVFNARRSQSVRVLFEVPCRVGLVYRRDQQLGGVHSQPRHPGQGGQLSDLV